MASYFALRMWVLQIVRLERNEKLVMPKHPQLFQYHVCVDMRTSVESALDVVASPPNVRALRDWVDFRFALFVGAGG